MEIDIVNTGFFRIETSKVQFTRISCTNFICKIPYLNIRSVSGEDRKIFNKNKNFLDNLSEEITPHLIKYRESIIQVTKTHFNNDKLYYIDNLRFIEDLIKNNIQFKIVIKENKSIIVFFHTSEWILYENKSQLKKIKNAMMLNNPAISIYDDLKRINKVIEVNNSGFEVKIGGNHSQLESTDRKMIKFIIQNIYKSIPKTGKLPVNYNGGYNFAINGKTYNLDLPSNTNQVFQVIQGNNIDLHNWLQKHLLSSNYNRMLVIGGNCPHGFEEIDFSNFHIHLIKMIRDDLSSNTWIALAKMIEVSTFQNNFSNYFIDLISSYIKDSSIEVLESIDFSSFYSTLGEMGRDDYVLNTVKKALALFNNREILSKGELIELPEKIFLPIMNTQSDIAITLVSLLLYYEYLGDDIDFILINDNSFSKYLISNRVKKVISGLLNEITVIYKTNNIFLNHFRKIDRLILRHNNSSKEYMLSYLSKRNKNLEQLNYPSAFISHNNIYWIDNLEKTKQFYHLNGFFEDNPNYRNFIIETNNFEDKTVSSEDETTDYDDEFRDLTTKESYLGKELENDDVCTQDLLEFESDIISNKSTESEEKDCKSDNLENIELKEKPVENIISSEWVKINTNIEMSNNIDDDVSDIVDEIDLKDSMTIDEIVELFKEDFELNEYITKSSGIDIEMVDAFDLIDILEQKIRYFSIFNTLIFSYMDMLNIDKFDDKDIIPDMIDDNLIIKEVIDSQTYNIMLQSKGKILYSSTMMIIKNLREKIKERITLYLENINEITTELRKEGKNTSFYASIAHVKLLAVACLRKSANVESILTGFVAIFDNQVLNNPIEFVSHFDATYLSELNKIKIYALQEEDEDTDDKLMSIPVLGNKIIKNEDDYEFEPVIRELGYHTPKRKINKERQINALKIGELLEDVPTIVSNPKPRRINVKNKVTKDEITKKKIIDKINKKKLLKKLNKRYNIDELISKGENKIMDNNRVIMYSSPDIPMLNKIKSLSIHHTTLSVRNKKILISYDIVSIEDLITFNSSLIPDLSVSQRIKIKEFIDKYNKCVEENSFDTLINKEGVDMLIRLGGYCKPDILPRNVLFELPQSIKSKLVSVVESSDTIEEMMSNVYIEIGDLIDENFDDSFAFIDRKLAIIQKRYNPMILQEDKLETFSISWLFTAVEKNMELNNAKQLILNDLNNLIVNNKIINLDYNL